MIPFVDANAWLYLANPQSPFHAKVGKALAEILSGRRAFAVSWQVFYEFMRCATDPRVYENPVPWKEAFGFISRVFGSMNARVLTEGTSHTEALEHVMGEAGFSRGHFIHDCHIAALLYENSIDRIITADHDFRRFSFLTVIDPTV